MSVLTLELPGHLQLANLSVEGKPMASFLSMCTRNEIVCAAQHMLTGQQREQFLIYAEQLACAICAETIVALPPPMLETPPTMSRAERLARLFLQEGSASLWSTVREVVRDLGYAEDMRAISSGYIFRLGMYNKGGLSGLTSETKRHPCVCRLINQLILSTLSTHAWTSISVNMNCGTEVHKDQGNASESDLFSLHIGLSHHQDGQLWVENTAGDMYMEHHKEGLIRGQVCPTSAVANLFHGQQHYHGPAGLCC